MRTGTGGLFTREHWEPTGSMLDAVASARLVEFELSEDRMSVRVTERCDDHFSAELRSADLGRLISELQALHGRMKNES